eukprot:GEZU01016114.1.p1 GENE.GEZU01016114.1~~GEZU01016114.1.p1  ORF type:complete len:439 (+),score=132.76 GEZU01016114.1:174-1490(+)
MWSTNAKTSKGLLPGRQTWGPLVLMVICPALVFFFYHTNVYLDGSYAKGARFIVENGFIPGIIKMIPMPTVTAAKMIACFMGFELLLMRLLPGKDYYGPVTPAGNIPKYKANGLLAYFVSVAAYLGLVLTGVISPGFVYDNYGAALTIMNLFSLVFCLFLCIKGRFFPSSSDSGTSGNFVFDYYWGTELFPRILGWDIKMFTNCRFGMMSWAILTLAFAGKQYENIGYISDSLLVCAALQMIYITKFFHWETGYLSTIDIMHDRAGFYICWGCLVWVPSLYTIHTFYLAHHAITLGTPLALAIFALGVISIAINYDTDRQRQHFRKTNGNCTIWGRKPEMIVAEYTTEKGEKKTSLLLLSGWWGLARHFHYLPELTATFFWTCPGLFNHVLPYSYLLFLTGLLVDRAHRDDARCASKYGKYWQQYCKRVPYRIVPYLY